MNEGIAIGRRMASAGADMSAIRGSLDRSGGDLQTAKASDMTLPVRAMDQATVPIAPTPSPSPSASEIPPLQLTDNYYNAQSVIARTCHDLFPDDEDHRAGCVKDQNDALSELKKGAPPQVAYDAFNSIRANCESQFASDYARRFACESDAVRHVSKTLQVKQRSSPHPEEVGLPLRAGRFSELTKSAQCLDGGDRLAGAVSLKLVWRRALRLRGGVILEVLEQIRPIEIKCCPFRRLEDSRVAKRRRLPGQARQCVRSRTAARCSGRSLLPEEHL